MAEKIGVYTQGKAGASGLTGRQEEVLRMLVEERLTQLSVAERLGISRQRVRQIVESLLDKGHDIPGVKKRGETVSVD